MLKEQYLIIFLIFIVLLTVIAYVFFHMENKKFQVTHYSTSFPNLPEAMDGKTIIFLSDLHNYCYGNQNENLLKAIENCAPDYVMIGGDMIVKGEKLDSTIILPFLKELASKYPVFYANGNHEYSFFIKEETRSAYEEYIQQLTQIGIIHLSNCASKLADDLTGVQVVGLDLNQTYYKKLRKGILTSEHLNKTIKHLNKNAFTILLAHNPIYFDEYATWGADLVLSGHVHGGMISLPFLGGVLSTQYFPFPKYDAGIFHKFQSTMVLSRGLGNHTIHIRFNNRAEVVAVHLRREK